MSTLAMGSCVFDTLAATLVNRSSLVTERSEGVAFFRVAKDLYQLADVTYLCLNIPIIARAKYYTHCLYSNNCVRQCMSLQPLDIAFVREAGVSTDAICWEPQGCPPLANGGPNEKQQTVTFPLRQRLGETAVFGIGVNMERSDWEQMRNMLIREWRILANYFHSHMLRMNGHDSEHDILMSARELDCLKWTAAGKTAWEASVILGISERTVKFHLNAAREKLNCAT